MKALGAIPKGFSAIDGILAIDGRKTSDLVEAAGVTPLFVYSRRLIAARIADLRASLPQRVAIHYAVKANPFGDVLEVISELVDGFDIASAGELAAVVGAGSRWPLSSYGVTVRDWPRTVVIRDGTAIIDRNGE